MRISQALWDELEAAADESERLINEDPEAILEAEADPFAEADAFAAALLMPAHLVRRHYERLRRRDDCFEQLCAAFGASGSAMGRRLHRVV